MTADEARQTFFNVGESLGPKEKWPHDSVFTLTVNKCNGSQTKVVEEIKDKCYNCGASRVGKYCSKCGKKMIGLVENSRKVTEKIERIQYQLMMTRLTRLIMLLLLLAIMEAVFLFFCG